MTRLRIDIEHRLPGFLLQVALDRDVRLLAVTGSSGAGKTTLLNAIAGLVRPMRGVIAVGPDTFLDTARGLDRPVHRRGIGYVFQDARLFPHLSVGQNLRFGRFFAARKPSAERERQIVDLLGIRPLLGRRTAGLSGGERQRTAIGRALLAGPSLLLMDEPLAALDEARKQEILPLIEAIRDTADVPILYVSHNPGEVARLADDEVRLTDGRIG